MKMTFKGQQYCVLDVVFLLLSGVILLFVTGCTKDEDPIKIGLATTLTGKASTWGISSRNAVSMAVEQINNAGGVNGRPIQLIVKNDKADPETALQVDKELLDEGVVAILGHYLSSPSMKTVPFMNERKTLMLSTGTSTVALTGLDDQFIRLLVPLDKKAPYLAGTAKSKLNIKKIALVYDLSNPKYTEPLQQHFAVEFERIGGDISKKITFDSRMPLSFPDIAREISSSGSDGVYIIANAINTALICQHMMKIGVDAKIIVSGWAFPDPDFIKNGGQAVEGVVAVNEFNKESTTEKFLRYKTQYEEQFNTSVSLADQISYEAAQILFKALKVTVEPEKIRDKILQTKVFDGLNGKIEIDKYGDPTRPLYVLTIQDQKIKTLNIINSIKP